MSIEKLTQLQEEIESLTLRERRELLSTLNGQQAAEARTQTWRYVPKAQERELFEVLCEVSHREQPLSSFVNSFGKNKFVEKSQEIYEFINQAGKLHPHQRSAMLSVCLRCLADDLLGRTEPIPPTPTTLLNHSGFLEFAVDRAFPGYLRAGMLHLVVAAAKVFS